MRHYTSLNVIAKITAVDGIKVSDETEEGQDAFVFNGGTVDAEAYADCIQDVSEIKCV